jgi:hypothetical protein
MCPMQYFIEYNLGMKSPSNKKADKGTICHKVFEILAFIKLNKQNNNKYFEDDIVGDVDISNYDLNNIIEQVYTYYISKFTHHEWTAKDFKDCTNWIFKALNYGDGMFDPRNREIVCPEQHFDLPITKDWAKYDYTTKEGRLKGNLAIKGTIDLITKVNDETYEIIDWKTGRRLDWATGEEKTLNKLHSDPQLMLYYYALHQIYPNIKYVIVSINFINDGGMFSVCFNESHLYQVEMMLKQKFETIKNTNNPPLNKSWKCGKLCHFGKNTFANSRHIPLIEYRNNQTIPVGNTMTICEQIKHDIDIKGINNVVDEYQTPGYNIGQYKAPGSAE